MSANEGTPKPGELLSADAAKPLIEKFVFKFRPPARKYLNQKLPTPSNMPTACLLKGKMIKEDFSDLSLPRELSVFAFFEGTTPNELFKTTLNDMAVYLKKREPWEDYDICVFDDSFTWCLGISHENQFTLALE